MTSKRIAVSVVGLLALLCSAVPTAQAQAPCSVQTFTGTYAFYERGSSSIFDANSQPYPFHWSGAYAPFVTVGEVTAGPDGIGHGFFWIRVGSFNGGLEPIPLETTITEMNEDCTGKVRAEFTLPGNPEPTIIVERFILFDNGREYRAVPTEIVNGAPTLAWIMEGHRISKPDEPLKTCGPQTAHGTYVWTVENLVRFSTTNPIFSDAVLLRENVLMTGDYTGTLYEKLGPTGDIELPTSGKITVNADCSFTANLDLVIQGNSVTAPIRGVFFDQGKKAFGLNMNTDPIGTQFSFGEAVRIEP